MSRPIFESTNHPLRRNRQRIRKSLCNQRFQRDFGPSSAARTHGLLVPNQARYQLRYTRIFSFRHYTMAEGENQSFFCLWSFLWSKPLLCRFRQEEEIPQTQALQGFEAFRLILSRIQPRHTQIKRPTNWATPGCL